MATGTVKWFNAEKGFGLITQDSGPGVFVTFTNILATGYRTLEEGQRVCFEIAQGPKGPQAVYVRVIGPHEDPGVVAGANPQSIGAGFH